METSAKKQEVEKTKTKEAKNLKDLFEIGLKDIYLAEKELAKSLPKMAKNASSPELINTLKNHLTGTEEHIFRLEEVFKSTGLKKPNVKKSGALNSLIKDTVELMKETKLGAVRDAGIIASEQKVKHYEIATYGTLNAFAKTLGEDKAAKLLATNLEEEKKADASLTDIALSAINSKAAFTNLKQKL